QATFDFGQPTVCRSPAFYCLQLDNTDGWGLSAGVQYVVTVTLVAADGTKQTSAFSAAATARALPVPPAVPVEQPRGTPDTASLGQTTQSAAIRGVGVNTATGAFTQHEVDASMTSAYEVNVSVERTYSSVDPTSGLLGVGWNLNYEARVFPGAD